MKEKDFSENLYLLYAVNELRGWRVLLAVGALTLAQCVAYKARFADTPARRIVWERVTRQASLVAETPQAK